MERNVGASENRIVLESLNDSVSLRQLIVDDAQAMFDLIEYDREHLSQHGDETAVKYPTVGSITGSIMHPIDPNKLRFGIWDGETMVGSTNVTPLNDGRAELGSWIGKQYIGNGYAGRARAQLTDFAFSQGYTELVCSIAVGNVASRRSVEKSGFEYQGESTSDSGERRWQYVKKRN